MPTLFIPCGGFLNTAQTLGFWKSKRTSCLQNTPKLLSFSTPNLGDAPKISFQPSRHLALQDLGKLL